MTETLNLKAVKKRAYKSINQDGLFDLMMGLLLLCIAVFFYISVFYNKEIVMLIIMPVIMIGPIIRNARKKYTYPRIGYVDLQLTKNKQILIMIFTFTFALGLFALFFFKPFEIPIVIIKAFPAAIGIIIAGTFLQKAKQYNIKRFYLYAWVGIISVILTYILDMRGIVKLITILFSLAVFFIPIGFFTFINFIRKNPVLSDDSGEKSSDSSMALEQKAIKEIHKDGLIDIFLGINLLLWIIYYFIGNFQNLYLYILMVLPPILLSLILHNIRKSNTFQRIGVDFLTKNAKTLSFIHSFMLMFLIGVGAFMIYATANTFYGKTEFGFILVLFGILLAGFFFVSGAVNEIKRNYFYGIVTLLTLGLGYILKYNSIKKFVLMLIILVLSLIPIGFIAYKKFLTEHQE